MKYSLRKYKGYGEVLEDEKHRFHGVFWQNHEKRERTEDR